MTRFILAPEAERDLDEIWEYIAQDDLDADHRFIDKLLENILMLAATPGMGYTREDPAEDRPLLFWPVGNCLILYRATTKPVVAIAHGRRDIPVFMMRRGESCRAVQNRGAWLGRQMSRRRAPALYLSKMAPRHWRW
jgi:toxin ParE1/3/4